MEYGEPPKKRKKVCPPGDSTGNAPEMIRVSPFRTKIIPRVVMNDGTPTTTVISPFASPTREPESTPTITASTIGRPHLVSAK